MLVPKHIVGRDDLITEMWSILERQGISLFAERRFGKSCVLRKMHSNNPKGFRTVYKSVQSITSPDDFVESLYQKTKDSGIISQKVGRAIESLWNTITGRIEEIEGVKLKSYRTVWQKKLVYLIQNLIESNPQHKIVIYLDEFSIMLDEMTTEDASQVIGFLRDIVPFIKKSAKTSSILTPKH